jgi:hypothetical protein
MEGGIDKVFSSPIPPAKQRPSFYSFLSSLLLTSPKPSHHITFSCQTLSQVTTTQQTHNKNSTPHTHPFTNPPTTNQHRIQHQTNLSLRTKLRPPQNPPSSTHLSYTTQYQFPSWITNLSNNLITTLAPADTDNPLGTPFLPPPHTTPIPPHPPRTMKLTPPTLKDNPNTGHEGNTPDGNTVGNRYEILMDNKEEDHNASSTFFDPEGDPYQTPNPRLPATPATNPTIPNAAVNNQTATNQTIPNATVNNQTSLASNAPHTNNPVSTHPPVLVNTNKVPTDPTTVGGPPWWAVAFSSTPVVIKIRSLSNSID